MIVRFFGSLICVLLTLAVILIGNFLFLIWFLIWDHRIFRKLWWSGSVRTDWHPFEWIEGLIEVSQIPWDN
jgi:hypothetical protein